MNSRVLHPADQICAILRRIYDGDMTTLTGGNLSMKDDDGVVWVSPSGIDKSALTREDIVKIMPDGSIEGKHRPTSEYRIHWQILRQRPDLKAILHAHPPALVTMSAVHEVPETRMLYPTYEAVGVPELAEYGFPGTLKLVECVVAAFDKGCQAAILKNHGVFLGSSIDLYDAFLRFEQLDFHARIQLLSGILGKEKEPEGQTLEKFQKELKDRMSERIFQGFFTHDHYSSRELELRRELKEFARRAYRKRLFTGRFGVISARVSESEFLISPLKKDNAFFREEDFVLIREGKCEAGKQPDVFAEHHREIYKKQPEIGSIIMAAPVYASAYAMVDKRYEVGVIPESYGVLRDCRRVPLEEINSNWARIAEESGVEHPFCILENMGILVMGETPLIAFDKLEVAESTAMTIHMACTGHREIKAMTEEMKREQDEQN